MDAPFAPGECFSWISAVTVMPKGAFQFTGLTPGNTTINMDEDAVCALCEQYLLNRNAGLMSLEYRLSLIDIKTG